MTEVNYELCETCEKNMEEAGVIGFTAEELFEKEAEFGMDVGVSLLEDGFDLQRKSKEKVLGSAIRLVREESQEYLASIQEGKIISYRTLTTEDLFAKDWKIANLPK